MSRSSLRVLTKSETKIGDGFLLAMEQAGRDDVEVIVRDDALKPDVGKRLSNEMIQREGVEILTGIIFSNVAMAVVPPVVRQGLFYLSVNAGPSQLAGRGCLDDYFNVAWQDDDLHHAMGGHVAAEGFGKLFILAPNYPTGTAAL